jgi:hypothetical protein
MTLTAVRLRISYRPGSAVSNINYYDLDDSVGPADTQCTWALGLVHVDPRGSLEKPYSGGTCH